jgi:penicillin amidase
MRWTLLENHPDDLIVKAVQDLNRAENAQDIHDALRYFNVPGQNFVYATVGGDFGYQYTGLAPIRTTPGSGVLPQNGSDPNFGWSGFVNYEDYLWERNPSKGFWATANQEIDYREETNKSDSFYIASLYAPPYRGDRINSLLDADNSVTVDDMKDIQGDTLDLYAKLMMEAVGSEIGSLELGNSLSDRFIGEAGDARDQLMKWDFHMDRGSIGALVFAGFRIFFEEATFKDEFDQQSEFNDEDAIFYGRYAGAAELGMAAIIDNPNSPWFDDVSTPDKVETRSDIVAQAFSETVEYLDNKISGRVASWKYGRLHHVVFEHPMGEALGFLNIGGDGSDGSGNTVKAAGGTPSWTEDGPNFTQTHGPSMRFVAEVETSWSEVYGIVVPGESSNFLSGHRNDGLDDWINNNSHKWSYTTERGGKPDFTYKVE